MAQTPKGRLVQGQDIKQYIGPVPCTFTLLYLRPEIRPLKGLLRQAEDGEKKLRKANGFCFFLCREKWMFPKIGGKTPQIIHFNRVFHYNKPSILGVFPVFLVQHPNEGRFNMKVVSKLHLRHRMRTWMLPRKVKRFLGFSSGFCSWGSKVPPPNATPPQEIRQIRP